MLVVAVRKGDMYDIVGIATIGMNITLKRRTKKMGSRLSEHTMKLLLMPLRAALPLK
jgi:hypothetical protein